MVSDMDAMLSFLICQMCAPQGSSLEKKSVSGGSFIREKSVKEELRPAYGRYPIKFILPEFVSYLGERGVLCVGNGSHFCTPVLMNL